MVGNICTIFGFISLILINCLDFFSLDIHSRLFGVFTHP